MKFKLSVIEDRDKGFVLQTEELDTGYKQEIFSSTSRIKVDVMLGITSLNIDNLLFHIIESSKAYPTYFIYETTKEKIYE